MYTNLGIQEVVLQISIEKSPISTAFIIFLNNAQIDYKLSQSSEYIDIRIRVDSDDNIIKISRYLARLNLALQNTSDC